MTARLAAEDVSLDAPIPERDGRVGALRLDRVVDTGASPDDALGERELTRFIHDQFEAFRASLTDERERFIFERRLLPRRDGRALTLQQIGARFRLSRERARQLEAKLVNRLREHLRAELPDFELMASAG